jgi:hypothetical protein
VRRLGGFEVVPSAIFVFALAFGYLLLAQYCKLVTYIAFFYDKAHIKKLIRYALPCCALSIGFIWTAYYQPVESRCKFRCDCVWGEIFISKYCMSLKRFNSNAQSIIGILSSTSLSSPT